LGSDFGAPGAWRRNSVQRWLSWADGTLPIELSCLPPDNHARVLARKLDLHKHCPGLIHDGAGHIAQHRAYDAALLPE